MKGAIGALGFFLIIAWAGESWAQVPGAQEPTKPVNEPSEQIAAPTEENPEGIAAPGAGPIDVEEQNEDRAVEETLEKLLPKYPGVRWAEVSVENQVVTLAGQVENADTRTRVTEFARRVEGVHLVLNRMKTDAQVMTAWELLVKVVSDLWQTVANRWLLVLLALGIVLIAFGLARLFWHYSQILLAPFIESPLLRSVVAPIISTLLVVMGLMLALRVLDLTQAVLSIVGLAGVVGLAISFAFRDIAENFIASVLLGIRRPFRISDYIQVAGYAGVVKALNTRATVLVTLEGNHVRIPNAVIYKEIMVNTTASPSIQGKFDIVIPYEASTAVALEAITQALRSHDGVLPAPPARALVEALEVNGVRLRASYWIPAREASNFKLQSDVRLKVKVALQQAGITPPATSVSLSVIGRLPVEMIEMDRPKTAAAPSAMQEQARHNLLQDMQAAASTAAQSAEQEIDLREHVLKEEETVTSDEGNNLLEGRQ